MNPYAQYLDGRDPIETMHATPAALQAIVAKLTPQQIEASPAPGKWSVCQVLAHLADCELNFAMRLRQGLETPGVTITPFNQDTWATRYSAYTAAQSLETFLALRAWNLSLLTTVSAAERNNTLTHPERGTMTFQALLETIGGHDVNHLQRLQHNITA